MKEGIIMRVIAVFFVIVVFLHAGAIADTAQLKIMSENIRNTPGGDKIGTVNKNSKMEIVEENDDWVKVNIAGWIWKNSIKIDRENRYKGALSIVSFDKKVLEEEYNMELGRYINKIRLAVGFQNDTDDLITDFVGNVLINDIAGENLFKLRVDSRSYEIKPGHTQELEYLLEPHHFARKEIYKYILNCKKDEINVEFEVEYVK
jgi:hypothetical protein